MNIDGIRFFANHHVEFADFVVEVGNVAGSEANTEIGGDGEEGERFRNLEHTLSCVFP